MTKNGKKKICKKNFRAPEIVNIIIYNLKPFSKRKIDFFITIFEYPILSDSPFKTAYIKVK